MTTAQICICISIVVYLVGMLVIEIVRGFVTGSVDLINPFIHLTVTATMYFCFSLYFKRKLGG